MTTPISATSPSFATSVASTASSSLSALSPEEQMLALMVYSQTSQMQSAKTSIDLSAEQLEKLHEQVRAALEKAREAEKSSGFWGGLAKLLGSDLASLASAVAAIAAVIATGGAAAPILAAIAVAASFAAEHAEDLGIPTEVAIGIAIAASVVAICAGDGKGLFEVSEKVRQVAGKVNTVATATQLGLEAGGAGCSYVSADYERTAGYAHADARQASGLQDVVSSDMDEALDRLAAAFDQQSWAVERMSAMQQQSAASSFGILNNWAGAA